MSAGVKSGADRADQLGVSRPVDIGAVVVGGDYQGLGIVRSLGRRGVPVYVLDDEPAIAALSRHTTRAVRVADLKDEQRTVDALLGLGRRYALDGWVLYPTREETVAAISRHRDALAERFRVPTPGWHAVEAVWDKRQTQLAAQRAGVPVARTWWPRGRAELDAVLAEADFPVVLKPAIKERFLYATGAKAWRADNREQLVGRFAEASAIVGGDGGMMIQELLPGDGRHRLAFCALVVEGRPVASLVARRARQHPPQFGRASTFVETVDVPGLEEAATRFLREIGYHGLVELEFMLDPRDGLAKLLDVNARTWGYHTIGAAAGVDFAWLLYAEQVGLEVEPVRGRTGVRWVRLLTDTPTALHEIARGDLGVRAWLRSLRGVDVEAVFSAEDPLPGLVELALTPYLVASRGY